MQRSHLFSPSRASLRAAPRCGSAGARQQAGRCPPRLSLPNSSGTGENKTPPAERFVGNSPAGFAQTPRGSQDAAGLLEGGQGHGARARWRSGCDPADTALPVPGRYVPRPLPAPRWRQPGRWHWSGAGRRSGSEATQCAGAHRLLPSWSSGQSSWHLSAAPPCRAALSLWKQGNNRLNSHVVVKSQTEGEIPSGQPCKKQQPLPTSPGVITPTRAHGDGRRVHLLAPVDGGAKGRAKRPRPLASRSASGPAPACPEQHPRIPPSSRGARARLVPLLSPGERGTRHPQELLQLCPSSACRSPVGCFCRQSSCLHAACPLGTDIPPKKPLSIVFLALSPRLSISPGPPASSRLGPVPPLTQTPPRRRAGTRGDSAEAAPCPRLSPTVATWQVAGGAGGRLRC